MGNRPLRDPKFGLAFALGFAMVACSKSAGDPSPEPSADAAVGDGAAASPGAPDGSVVDRCRTSCESMHPIGDRLHSQLDACRFLACEGTCETSDAGAGGAPPSHGDCTQHVSTSNAGCSQCTVDSCCTQWDACLGDPDCKALEQCLLACFGP